MAKRKATTKRKTGATRRKTAPRSAFDTDKFENVLQIGGIQTAMLESPTGSGQLRRVALFNTGSPLRFTVALDRGGDIVDASYGQYSLTYLSPTGIKAPSHAYHSGLEWLYGWAGGLVTTCGPEYCGQPREEDGKQVGLHGHHSNTPAAVEMLINPDPHRGRHEMLISMTVRDSRMFGPHLEVRRTIVCTLGVPEIRLFDEVTNRGNERCAHSWLYHVNLGYPLLDEGTRLIFRGKVHYVPVQAKGPSDAELNQMKRVGGTLKEHLGPGERCLFTDVPPDRNGNAHAGLINQKLKLAIELVYPTDVLPRFNNWQHFGPRGSYITGIEPFSGSILGKHNEDHPLAEQYLSPGQTKRYQLTVKLHSTPKALTDLAKHDGKLFT